jgi:glycerol-3-phosphate acyltransferase PlsY
MSFALTAPVVIALVASYFMGAIPFGLLAGKLRGIDIRATGSGNIGATNVWRTLGPKAGTAVFALDVLKGYAVPALARMLVGHDAHVLTAACAALAILGHTFSLWLHFRGGKGIATGFGAMLGLVPLIAIGCLVAWVLALAISRMISVASIVACLVAPLGLYLTHAEAPYIWVVSLLTLVALIKHTPNVGRILRGTEPRIGKRQDTSTVETRVPAERADTPGANSHTVGGR